MVDTKYLNFGFSGKVGNRVYFEIDGVRFSRAYFIPVQPGTPPQVARWTKFRDGVTSWHSLNSGQREAWNKRAINYRMTGYNLYLSYWLRDKI